MSMSLSLASTWMPVVLFIFCISTSNHVNAVAPSPDISQLSLEDLLDVEVVSVSKFLQKTSSTPSAVTVISADDIRTYGWHTLADALNSVRGFSITSNRVYSYAGVRGFAPLGDSNDRLLVMIDGMRVNDNIYDQAQIGTEFALDMELVERIEIMRGPGSSMYGNNALFGVVNVITRQGVDIGRSIGVEADTLKSWRLRGTDGGMLNNGGDYVLSASHEYSPGETLTFPEFSPNATTSGADSLHNDRLYGKFSRGGFSLTGIFSRREQGNPAALGSGVFNDPRNRFIDQQTFVDTRYQWKANEMTELSARLFFGSHDYNGDYMIDHSALGLAPPLILNRDFGQGQWWGVELKGVSSINPVHKLVYGVETQYNERQRLFNYDVTPNDPSILCHKQDGTPESIRCVDDNQHSRRIGIYAQDEWHLTKEISTTLGGRYDKVTNGKQQFSPRFALVWRINNATVWKSSYGTAFRVPNAAESFWQNELGPNGVIGLVPLKPEHIQTLDTSIEHYLNPDLRLTATAYLYRMENQIAVNPHYTPPPVPPDSTPQYDSNLFANLPSVTGQGLEMEVEKLWNNGARLRASGTVQGVRDNQGQWPVNSPRWDLKLNHSVPAFRYWRFGVEAQVVGPQRTNQGEIDTQPVFNLTLLRPMTHEGWECSINVHDVFNRQPPQPIAEDFYAPLPRNTVPGEGRSLRLMVTHRF